MQEKETQEENVGSKHSLIISYPIIHAMKLGIGGWGKAATARLIAVTPQSVSVNFSLLRLELDKRI